MHMSEQTERAIEACYDAALASERWPSALQMLGESLAAQSCTFATGDLDDPFQMPRSEGHEDFAQLWLQNEPHAPDPHRTARAPRQSSVCRTGYGFILEQDVSTEKQRRTLPYYQETAAPGNRDWWASACFKVGARPWCVSLYRGAARGAFSSVEAGYAADVVPHLSKVIGLAQKVADGATAAGLKVLERFSCAAIVVDAVGVASLLNASAQTLLGSHFNLVRGRPVASDRASNCRLQNLIAAALGARGEPPSAHAPVVIHRDGLPWLMVDAVPVTAFGSDFFNTGRAILTLADLTVSVRPNASLLTIAYGLTAAEGKIAVGIASGRGIDDAASDLGITRETARTQLKAVFAKTNTSRQAELTNLLVRLRHSRTGPS
jgi:DNA-binding CsgD family transcriptional regulator